MLGVISGFVAICVVTILLFATLLYQYHPIGRIVGRFDVFRILPKWTFFAPNPSVRDCHLVIRDRIPGGRTTPWSEVSVGVERTTVDFIWHPSKRSHKVFSDAVQSIKLLRREGWSNRSLETSLPYLMILHFCSRQERITDRTEARQFAIIETSGREERRIWVAFISDFHQL